jgi:two-component system, OmpR family, response regulator
VRPDRTVSALVADDNRDAADTLALFLGLHGCVVRVTYDGPAAVRAALEHPPDLAVLDIGMPGLDGCAVARELRGHPVTKAIKLVAMTGYSEAEMGSRVADAGFDRHLVKGRVGPDGMEGLVEVLDEIRQLATETRGLLRDAKAEFRGAKDEIRETRQEVREVKEELKEVKEELREVKEELKGVRPESDPT